RLNDTYGHAAGDVALLATAHRLNAWCGRHGIAARLGGDEFTAVITDPGNVPDLATLRRELNRPISADGHTIPLAASVGACAVADL
ncbi:diguanylate cyclase domain-containing protein, partial [Streptomyces alkaliterrae]